MRGAVRTWGIGSRIVSAWRFHLDERFNAKFGAALLAFNGEAVVYCRGTSEQAIGLYKKTGPKTEISRLEVRFLHGSFPLPSSCGLTSQKYSVVWTTLRQAAPHALNLDDEPAIAQTPLEFPIIPGRPNGQDPAALESGMNGS